MRLYIMRHGETELNKKKLLQGQMDCPLSKAGEEQAREAGRKIRERELTFDRIYSSPLCRAVRTASLAGEIPEEEVRVDGRLIELDYGPFEGKGYAELDKGMYAFFEDPLHNSPPEGIESVERLIERVTDFLQDLEKEYRENPGEFSEGSGNILLVTHGVAIRAMMAYLRQMTGKEIWHLMIDNCEMFVTELGPEGYGLPERVRAD